MNTKADAVFRATRIAEIWLRIGITCLSIALGLLLYVGWLHTQLHNCNAGGIQ